jgi:hypothetical protein
VRAALALLAGACALAAAACGSDAAGVGERAGDALQYVPAGAPLVVLVSTDLESEQVRILDERVVVPLAGQTLAEVLEDVFGELGLAFAEVRPLLGNDVVVATTNPIGLFAGEDPGVLVAFDAGDEARLRTVVEGIAGVEPLGEEGGARLYAFEDFEFLALDGPVLLAAGDEQTLRAALARTEGVDDEEIGEALGDLPADAPVRAFGQIQGYLERQELASFRGLPWVDALRSLGLTLSATEEEVQLDARVSTDPDGLDEDDLPLVTGDESPEVLDRSGELAGANLDQSRTTVFLLRAVRHAYPDSRFVRRVAELEQQLGVDFEEEVLRQFDGPSVSAVSADGQRFAARSEVRDPERLRDVLGRLAPVLPGLVESLEALRSQGLAALFLIAPDAPVALDELEAVEVEEPAMPDGLFRITGLTGDGPEELWFGLVGDVFVVASSEAEALAVAEEPTIEAEGAEGAGVLRASFAELARELGIELVGAGEVVGSLEASTEGLRARLRVELD